MPTNDSATEPPTAAVDSSSRRVRVIAMAAIVASVLAIGGASVSRPRQRGPIRIAAHSDGRGALQPRNTVVKVLITLRCSSSSLGEVDAILEQPGTRLRAVRNIATQCDEGEQVLALFFEANGRKFATSDAVLRLDAMAGFGETFGQTHLGPVKLTLRSQS